VKVDSGNIKGGSVGNTHKCSRCAKVLQEHASFAGAHKCCAKNVAKHAIRRQIAIVSLHDLADFTRVGCELSYPVHRTHFTVNRTPCTVHRSPSTLHRHRAPCTVHRSPSTFTGTVHRSPFTLHRAPCAVHRSPCTIHRPPFTIHCSPPSTSHVPHRSPFTARVTVQKACCYFLSWTESSVCTTTNSRRQ
jgi:hypothetical protein